MAAVKGHLYRVLIMAVVWLTLPGQNSGQLSNRAPHFVPGTGDMTRFSLPENTPVGSPVYQLKGIDPEGSVLRYSISGPVFTVERDTGVVRLLQELDRESQDMVEVIISITDEGIFNTEPNTVSLRREIPIRDYNDNPPVFLNRPYSISVSEAAPPGSVVEFSPSIEITDRDEGANADVHVECYVIVRDNNVGLYDDVCDVFDIATEKISEGHFKAVITLRKYLDFESRSSYILTLRASDGDDVDHLSSWATAVVQVLDVQDQPPTFLNAPYSATVPENTPEGTSVLTIMAADGDTGNSRPLLLTLEGETLGVFTLNASKEGDQADLVTTGSPLDREHPLVLENGGVYTFSVRATELINNEVPAEYSVSQITIVITDVDDHIPTFNRPEFHIEIPENIENDTPLPGLSIFVTDEDIGHNSLYNLSLRNIKNAEDVFLITPLHGYGRTPLVIKVNNSSKLDYDVEDISKRKLIVDVVAVVNKTEVGFSRINIDLQDSNDNSPIFGQQTYKLFVDENSKIGLKIGNISATDKDSGVFSKLTYTLKGFGSEFFRTDPDSGGVFVNRYLDYEHQKSYSLTMVAKDGGGRVSTVNVFIDINDLNDNSPYFELLEYTRTIREGATEFEPQFFVQATDLDGPDQGGDNLTYSIQSENSISGHVFSVAQFTGEILITKPVSSMDTSRGQYELSLRATDHGTPPLFNETRVLIRVGIAGNQRPVFKGGSFVGGLEAGPLTYRASIPERAPPGYKVTQVIANDPDGQDSLLTYHIAGGARDNFVVNQKTGELSVSAEARLDRDSNPTSYSVQITAVDTGSPFPETATTTVFVTIKDVNDKPPKFNSSSNTAYVSERSVLGKNVLKVQATDSDVDSKLTYSIIEPIKAVSKSGVQLQSTTPYNYKYAFKINETSGIISVNNTLDYNSAAVIILTVQARDINAVYNIEEQFAVMEVTLYIQSYKDDNPLFRNEGWAPTVPIIKINVKEEIPIGTVLIVLNAEDPINQKPITNYQVLKSNTNLLQVNEISGIVTLSKRLDYESLNGTSVTVAVEAISNDFLRRSVANVNITVENINDNVPIFEKGEYRTSVVESSRYPERVLTVQANDSDATKTDLDTMNGFGEVFYSINGEHASSFIIDNKTGIVQIAPNQTIDRERQSVLRFSVVARDSPGKLSESKTSSAQVVIDVLDVNDNPPVFKLAEYTAVVPENVPKGSSVANLTATDPDEGLGGEIKYEIVDEGDANGLLDINATTGEIKTKRQLTGKGRTEPYILHVRVQDGGSQLPSKDSLHSDVMLTLYVGDISANDGVPVFIKPTKDQQAFISENATLGSPVFQVVASDPDDPSQPAGKLTYHIQDDTSDALAFKIDRDTGLITTRRPLDRETKDQYKLILVVRDRGSPPQAATRVLPVMVTDIDDHRPRFIREVDSRPIEMYIKEEQQNGTVIGNFSAVDDDIGENGAIDYIIIDGNERDLFSILRTKDNKAVIRTNGRLDREITGSYLLTVKCFKYQTKSAQITRKTYNKLDQSEIQIAIEIQDIDDHLPVFEHPHNLTLGIRLTVPVDTSLLTLQAVDIDADALPIVYSVVNITFTPQVEDRPGVQRNLTGVFRLNNVTGEIRTGRSLVKFVDGYFRLGVRANNSNLTGRYSDMLIQMYIVRDRSLLRFVFARPPGEVRSILEDFTREVQNSLSAKTKANKPPVILHVFDIQVLAKPDQSLDFGATSSCFQLTRAGQALTPGQMTGVLEDPAVKAPLVTVFGRYRMSLVEPCSSRRQVGALAGTRMAGTTATQLWLLALSLLVGAGALVACVTVCCLHRKYKRRSRALLQRPRRSPNSLVPVSDSPYGGVPIIYAEPLYSSGTLHTAPSQHTLRSS